ncbi:uncharacterized protein EI90DRAFT_3019991 [Cantharellus anzutake]|uniref:uncharacterized protein n=1 Tax=Cantharellus anzutake TaxID=1750568 RepID=UPI001906A3E3|nr:uncharacterized protein EI90DRAFT_3019991 [Cantharellus anzutake]KAF8322829.1 hypothetical protein EI90DRAFT_3019991 [Cantharellus anzutake]
MSGHQNPGNAVAGTAIENPIDPIDKAISMLLPSQRSTAEGCSHDTIPSFASTSTLPGFLPAATEPSAFPEPASVDDFLFELDGGIEPTLKPPLPDDIPSTTAISPRGRLSVPFSRTPTLSSTIAPSVASSTSFTSSLRKKVRYGDLQGVPHRFLILHVTRVDGREFYLRLDRRRDRQVPLLLFGVRDLGTSRAIDTAAVSGRLDHLLDFTNTKSGIEAVIVFPTPAPLIAAAQILYAIAAESPGYKLTKENCWFFASTIQEVLVRGFGGVYERGSLNHPTIGAGKRDGIKDLAYSHLEKQINDKSEAILRYANLIAESKLTQAIKSVLDAVKYHHSPHPPEDSLLHCSRHYTNIYMGTMGFKEHAYSRTVSLS